jgi:hypothetical protein
MADGRQNLGVKSVESRRGGREERKEHPVGGCAGGGFGRSVRWDGTWYQIRLTTPTDAVDRIKNRSVQDSQSARGHRRWGPVCANGLERRIVPVGNYVGSARHAKQKRQQNAWNCAARNLEQNESGSEYGFDSLFVHNDVSLVMGSTVQAKRDRNLAWYFICLRAPS